MNWRTFSAVSAVGAGLLTLEVLIRGRDVDLLWSAAVLLLGAVALAQKE